MKKVIKYALVLSLVLSSMLGNVSLRVKATNSPQINDNYIEISEDVIFDELDWSNNGMENVKIVYRSKSTNIRTLISKPSVEVDFVQSSTGKKVHFERIDNIGYYYEDGKLITTIEYGTHDNLRLTIPNSAKSQSTTAGAGFSTFYYCGYRTWIARQIRNLGQSSIVSLFTGGILGALSAKLVSAVVNASDLAISIYNNYEALNTLVDDFYAVDVEYRSLNVQCNILEWYGVQVYQATTNFGTLSGAKSSFKKGQNHYWLANPTYDFTQPDACRALLSTYPI